MDNKRSRKEIKEMLKLTDTDMHVIEGKVFGQAENAIPETQYFGENPKEFFLRKDLHITLKYEDILTTEGTVKQDILKLFLMSNSVKKLYEVVRKHLIKAIFTEGRQTIGALRCNVTESVPYKELDKDMLSNVLHRHGYTLDQFYKEGSTKKTVSIR